MGPFDSLSAYRGVDNERLYGTLLRLQLKATLYASMAGPSNCFNAWTYSVRAWRPVLVMR